MCRSTVSWAWRRGRGRRRKRCRGSVGCRLSVWPQRPQRGLPHSSGPLGGAFLDCLRDGERLRRNDRSRSRLTRRKLIRSVDPTNARNTSGLRVSQQAHDTNCRTQGGPFRKPTALNRTTKSVDNFERAEFDAALHVPHRQPSSRTNAREPSPTNDESTDNVKPRGSPLSNNRQSSWFLWRGDLNQLRATRSRKERELCRD